MKKKQKKNTKKQHTHLVSCERGGRLSEGGMEGAGLGFVTSHWVPREVEILPCGPSLLPEI